MCRHTTGYVLTVGVVVLAGCGGGVKSQKPEFLSDRPDIPEVERIEEISEPDSKDFLQVEDVGTADPDAGDLDPGEPECIDPECCTNEDCPPCSACVPGELGNTCEALMCYAGDCPEGCVCTLIVASGTGDWILICVPETVPPACTNVQDCVDAAFPESPNLCQQIACLASGFCGYEPRECDDGFDCTIDGCENGAVGCQHVMKSDKECQECTTDDDCTSPDPCDLNQCVPCPVVDGTIYYSFECPVSGKICFRKHCAGCDDKNPCTDDSCDSAGVVTHSLLDCHDHNECTLDYCWSLSGQAKCFHDAVPDCNQCEVDEDCNTIENNVSPACLVGHCIETGESGMVLCADRAECPAGKCIGGICVVKKCYFEPKDCNDDDPCTTDSCDPKYQVDGQGNGCHHELSCFNCEEVMSPSPECDDQNSCTIDSCVEAETGGGAAPVCSYDPVDCDDGDPATICWCESETGCQCASSVPMCPGGSDEECLPSNDPCIVPICSGSPKILCLMLQKDCDDSIPCTDDSCDKMTGECFSIPTEACPSCDSCVDMGPCLLASCHEELTLCYWKVPDCDDGDDCTVDWCDPDLLTGGCKNVLLPPEECQHCPFGKDWECEPPNNCWTGKCHPELNPPKGICVFKEVSCPVNPCLVDSCDPDAFGGEGGCVFMPKDCNDDDLCTIDGCNPTTGCYYENKVDSCEDGLLCTDDQCDPLTGECVYVLVSCDDGDSCTIDHCDPETGACTHDSVDCDDDDPCTLDDCSPSAGCVHQTIVDCTPCMKYSFNADTCKCEAESKCNDGKWWTWDECDPATGECSFPLRCEYPPPSICHVEGTCAWECNDVNTGECYLIDLGCDDENLCTADSCDLETGECFNVPKVVCETDDKCQEAWCNPTDGKCGDPWEIECYDGNPCTFNYCSASYGCYFAPDPDCAMCTSTDDCAGDAPDMCHSSFCNNQNGEPDEGFCEFVEADCNDGNCFTKDWCDLADGSCQHEPAPPISCPPEAP